MPENTLLTSKRIKITVFITILIAVALFIFNYSFVRIEAVNTSSNAVFTMNTPGGESKKASPGLKLLHTGEYTVEMSSDNQKTTQTFFVKSLSFKKIVLDFKKQKNVYKVGNAINQCLIGDTQQIKQGNVMSYDCLSSSSILTSNYKSRLSGESIPGIKDTDVTARYKDGILLLTKVDDEKPGSNIMFLSSKTKQATVFRTWNGNKDPDNYKLQVVNDRVYVLDIINHKVLTFPEDGSKPSEQSIDLIGSSSGIRFWVNGGRYYIFEPSDDSGEDGSDEFTGGNLNVFDRTNGKSIKSIPISKDTDGITSMQIVDPDTISVLNVHDSTVTLYKLGDELEATKKITNIKSYEVVNNAIYTITQDGEAYQYNTVNQSSYLVFKSSNITISAIDSLNGQVFLNGYTRSLTEDTSGISLLVENEDQNKYPRIEDIVPIDFSNTDSVITYVDYVGNDVTITLSLPSKITNKQTGKISFDPQEFETNKQKAIKELKDKGLSTDSYNLIFTDI